MHLKITEWAEEDRPREKMQMKGAAALSDAELLAILIGSGNKNETAVELSKRILHTVNNNLNSLGKLDIKELISNFNGIGEAKAITIAAALELGRRQKISEAEKIEKIVCSVNVYNIFHPLLSDLKHEEFWVLLLGKSNNIIKKTLINRGNENSVGVDIKLILKEAIETSASGIILCHNHPDNNSSASKNDDDITFRLYKAAALMDIALLDHIIICNGTYYSYKDSDKL
ncbi:DNA repair protein RadC [Dysgonomonas sp. 216]|uniref:RadC family protein n=1 Tax=Dysgonomonas sp. 216 TaxID=2302934 RepID=UPI0013D69C2C|nr:DNA repair protein RadC [Dysgonomonas sp. 216]NDW17911.1 DNA repair protein RadC [Dysgonomonas sp. 216]